MITEHTFMDLVNYGENTDRKTKDLKPCMWISSLSSLEGNDYWAEDTENKQEMQVVTRRVYVRKKEKWSSGNEGQERISNFLKLTELMKWESVKLGLKARRAVFRDLTLKNVLTFVSYFPIHHFPELPKLPVKWSVMNCVVWYWRFLRANYKMLPMFLCH